MLSILCSCIRSMTDKNNDGVPDIFQQISDNRGEFNSPLVDVLRGNLLSLRGRRERIRNIPIDILPTKFDDDVA